jgi:hypothetical protein
MAQPKIIRGTYFSLMARTATGPDVYTALCGVTTRTFTAGVNASDQFTRDCADPEDVPIRRRIVTGKQWTLAGEGSLNRDNLETILGLQAVTENYRFVFTEPDDDEVFQGHWTGPGILESITITAEDEAFATISFTIESDGEWAFAEVTPA